MQFIRDSPNTERKSKMAKERLESEDEEKERKTQRRKKTAPKDNLKKLLRDVVAGRVSYEELDEGDE